MRAASFAAALREADAHVKWCLDKNVKNKHVACSLKAKESVICVLDVGLEACFFFSNVKGIGRHRKIWRRLLTRPLSRYSKLQKRTHQQLGSMNCF